MDNEIVFDIETVGRGFIITMTRGPEMANPSSYNEEDIKKIIEYREKYPDAWCWTTIEGLSIPLHLIKDDHLKNIKRFINQHPNHYNKKVFQIINKEWKKRFASSPAGKVLFG